MNPDLACDQCIIGIASGVGQGQFCPFITRAYRQGELLYRQGEGASYAWFVKSGVIALYREDTNPGARELVQSGNFVGLESLASDRYQTTATVLADAVLCGASKEGFAQWLAGESDRMCTLLRMILGPAVQTDAGALPPATASR